MYGYIYNVSCIFINGKFSEWLVQYLLSSLHQTLLLRNQWKYKPNAKCVKCFILIFLAVVHWVPSRNCCIKCSWTIIDFQYLEYMYKACNVVPLMLDVMLMTVKCLIFKMLNVHNFRLISNCLVQYFLLIKIFANVYNCLCLLAVNKNVIQKCQNIYRMCTFLYAQYHPIVILWAMFVVFKIYQIFILAREVMVV